MLVFSGGLFKFDKDLKPYRYLRDFSLSPLYQHIRNLQDKSRRKPAGLLLLFASVIDVV